MMGMVFYPYADIQDMLWASEIVRVERSDPNNPFRWDEVGLNLPGDPN